MADERVLLTERQRFWLDHVRASTGFDGTMKAYAEAHGLSVAQLYSWKSKLKGEGHAIGDESAPRSRAESGERTGTRADLGSVNAVEFLSLQLLGEPATRCQIHLPNGIRIECSAQSRAQWQAIVEACLGQDPPRRDRLPPGRVDALP